MGRSIVTLRRLHQMDSNGSSAHSESYSEQHSSSSRIITSPTRESRNVTPGKRVVNGARASHEFDFSAIRNPILNNRISIASRANNGHRETSSSAGTIKSRETYESSRDLHEITRESISRLPKDVVRSVFVGGLRDGRSTSRLFQHSSNTEDRGERDFEPSRTGYPRASLASAYGSFISRAPITRFLSHGAESTASVMYDEDEEERDLPTSKAEESFSLDNVLYRNRFIDEGLESQYKHHRERHVYHHFSSNILSLWVCFSSVLLSFLILTTYTYFSLYIMYLTLFLLSPSMYM